MQKPVERAKTTATAVIFSNKKIKGVPCELLDFYYLK